MLQVFRNVAQKYSKRHKAFSIFKKLRTPIFEIHAIMALKMGGNRIPGWGEPMKQEKAIVNKVLKDIPVSIFDDIPLPINCVDENGVIVIMNKAFIEYYGEPSFKSFIGKRLTEFDHSTRLPIILKNGIPEIGMKHRFATGKVVTVDRIPILESGKIIGGIGIIVPDDIENMPQASQIRQSIIQAIRPDWKPTFETRSLLNNSRYRIDDIISKSSVINHFKKRAESFAVIDLPVLISGESGVGKEPLCPQCTPPECAGRQAIC